MGEYFFTVFIPTYNRAHLLQRLFDSIERQSYRDFEVIIVDDGSSDRTEELVKSFKKKYDYPIRYFYQQNQGKHVARNLGIKKAKGFMFKTIDSSDLISNDCLEVMKKTWETIDPKYRSQYAGVIGLSAYLKNNEIVGDKFPTSPFDSNHFKNSNYYGIRGDKTQCIRTDILKKNLFPVFENEKFIPESVVWHQIGLKYKFRYINRVMRYMEHREDGLTNNAFKITLNNCKGVQYIFKMMINEILPNYETSLKKRYGYYLRYSRFSHHCGDSYIKQKREVPSRLLLTLAYPLGWIVYKYDKIKLEKKLETEEVP